MEQKKYKIILCDLINPVSDNEAELIRNSAVVLKNNSEGDPGQDSFAFFENGKAEYILNRYNSEKGTDILDRRDQLMLPAFFDIHFHWVQDDVRLMPKENLLLWLSEYVWPYEADFINSEYSRQEAVSFGKKLLAAGTLGGACYASIHGHTVDHALENFKGRFAAGNVLMTMNSPDYLTQTEEDAVRLVEEKSSEYRERYAATPRFALTTGPDVMKACSEIARKNNSFIQTHLSETEKEIEAVLSCYRKIDGFEDIKTYTEIYKRCGILSSATIMGHCIHLSDEEYELLSETGTSIAHCPTSNAPVKDSGLGSGLFDFRKAEKAGVKWALASDIGGGPFLSMFDVMRSFVIQNRERGIDDATYVKALYRSTAAGAEILGLNKICGSLDTGKAADFILIDSPAEKEKESAEEILKTAAESRADDRTQYLDLVQSTFFGGTELYLRKKNND